MLDGLSQVDEPFDVVFSSFALHHLAYDEKRRFFDLSHRAMKQDGVLLLVDVMREDMKTLQPTWMHILAMRPNSGAHWARKNSLRFSSMSAKTTFPKHFPNTVPWPKRAAFRGLTL